MQAIFLRHEGFLGALGAFMSYESLNVDNLLLNDSKEQVSTETTLFKCERLVNLQDWCSLCLLLNWFPLYGSLHDKEIVIFTW